MVTFILHFLSLVIMAWTYLPNMLNSYLLTSLLVLIFFFFVVATNTILFIGISTARFSKQVEQIQTQSLEDFEQNLQDLIVCFAQIKTGGGPILFVTFGIETIYFIFTCYLIKVDRGILSLAIYEILKLSYIAFSVEDCFNKYKSLIRTGR